MKKRYGLVALVALTILIPFMTLVAQAADPDFGGVTGFRNKWIEQDRLVGAPGIDRPYTWGPSVPEAPTVRTEPYKSSPGGNRQVLYLDKARMEINNPANGFVTTGLAVKELVSGQRQDGDADFTPLASSKTQVAGDPVGANPNAPVYESFKAVVTLGNADGNSKPSAIGSTINASIGKSGTVGTITPPVNLTIGAFQTETGHNIAQVFDAFKNLNGPLTDPVSGNRIENQPIYTINPTSNVFGLAISEPYWVSTRIAGVDRQVLVQLFERRVLTYNPAIPGANKVEMGNVGQHYYQWRYVESTGTPPPTTTTPPPTTTPVPTPAVPSDYSQFRANYNKSGADPVGGAANVTTYSAGSNVNSSPILATGKDLVIFGTSTNGLQGVNPTSLSNVFTFKPSGNPSFNTDPIIYNGTIYAGASDGRVYAVDLNATGTNVADKGRTAAIGGGTVRGSVAFAPDASQLYYVVGSSLYAVDLKNLSSQKWVQTAGGAMTAPVVDSEGNIFVGSADSKLHAFKPNGQKLADFYPITVVGSLEQTQPTLANGAVYLATNNGKVVKINPTTGGTIWTATVDPVADIDSTVAVVGTDVYVATNGSRVHKLNDANGTVEATFTTTGLAQSSPAVVGNFFYLGDDSGRVYKVDVNNFANKTELITGATGFTNNSPVVADGKLYIVSPTGTLYVVK